ncbi:MAG: VanZ family protein [Candidatus Bipolaricaulota bacterium]|nr:VanZ family protein [Candidatus Bipolaricaulota bacterium]MBS3791886.1 VanZ family protein [Candidatus Bipolaricaulota bacterium]
MKGLDYPTETIKKAGWTAIFTVYAGIIFYGSIYPIQEGPPLITVPGADKLIHAGEFALFTLIGYRTLSYYSRGKESKTTLILLSMFYGGLTELVQAFLPYRGASAIDWFADIFGVAVGLLVIVVIKKWRTKKEWTYTEPN